MKWTPSEEISILVRTFPFHCGPDAISKLILVLIQNLKQFHPVAGHLYYGTIDKVATDESLWSRESLKERRITKQQSSDYKVHIAESQLDRANELDIKANLALSFMGGLIKITGSAKYLEDRKRKKNSGGNML